MSGTWCHLHQCFSAEQRSLLCNRCLIEDTCQSGHVAATTLFMLLAGTRCAGMLPREGEAIPQRILLWFSTLNHYKYKEKKAPSRCVCGGLFLFCPEREASKQFLLSLSVWEHQRCTPPCSLSWGWDPSPYSAAPAPAPESGSGLRLVLLLSADQHLWETSLSVCGSAQGTKWSLFLHVTPQSKVQVIPSGQLYKPALSGSLLEQSCGFQYVCTAVASG